MTKQTFIQKSSGDTLSAIEWNDLTSYVNTAVDAINEGASGVVSVAEDQTATDPTVNVAVASGVQTIGNPNVIQLTKKKKGVNTTVVSENNINIEPRESIGTTKGGNISFKPGDDIEFCSHHRLTDNQDEVSVKVIDGNDVPVKLQLNAAEMTLTTKDKTGTDAAVFDINVNSAKNTKGYLKVRARAIDLRCEDHGGIAIQPKGVDGSGNMNKIKFEHGGGDGLEFGTFNTEKTSIFTDEYRFNKDGVWKMATRIKQVSDKADGVDPTTAYKYVKAADDFYDNIDPTDEQCTTNNIIKTAHAFNNSKNRHAKYEEKTTTSGNLKKTLEIETVVTINYEATNSTATSQITIPAAVADVNQVYSISDFKNAIKTVTVNDVVQKYGTAGDSDVTLSAGDIVTIDGSNYTIVENFAPSIDIKSDAEISIKGDEKLSIGGKVVEFGTDTVDLGEMEDGLYAQYKLTKKNNSKPCDTLKIKVINNTTNALSFDSDSGAFAIDSFYPGSDANHPAAVTIPAKLAEPTTDAEATLHIQVVAQCKLYDVIKFVAWAKANDFGPWAV